MTQYNSLNVQLSNSQLNKFKSVIQNANEVVLRLSPNMIGDNETNFLRTNRQVIDKFQIFVKLLQIIYQLMLSYQNFNYVR